MLTGLNVPIQTTKRFSFTAPAFSLGLLLNSPGVPHVGKFAAMACHQLSPVKVKIQVHHLDEANYGVDTVGVLIHNIIQYLHLIELFFLLE